MDLPSLIYCRYCGDMTEVYKFIHGIYTSGYNLLPRAPRSALRGHGYKLKKRYCHSQLRANFCFRVVNLWNRLPCEVLSAPTVNTFKHRLDNYWADYCYTLDPDFLRRWTTEQPTGLIGLKSRAEDKGKGKVKVTRRLTRRCFIELEYLHPRVHRVALWKDWKTNRRVGANEPQSRISWWTKVYYLSPSRKEVSIVWYSVFRLVISHSIGEKWAKKLEYHEIWANFHPPHKFIWGELPNS